MGVITALWILCNQLHPERRVKAGTNDVRAFAAFVNHSDAPFKSAVIAGDATLNIGAQGTLTAGLLNSKGACAVDKSAQTLIWTTGVTAPDTYVLAS